MADHPKTNLIAKALSDKLSTRIRFTSWIRVSGGSIHAAWKVNADNGLIFFIKTNTANQYPSLEAEALGLTTIAQHLTPENSIQVPRVYLHGHDNSQAWLVLSYIEFEPSTPITEQKLGEGLALLHQQTSTQFGLTHDNVIGLTAQSNQQMSSWIDFFAEQRLEPQFRFAQQHDFYKTFALEAESLLHGLTEFLGKHQPQASLLHGDLWSGNVGFSANNTPIIYDPAVYYGDRECDIAMSMLFGGFSKDFYAAYDHVYPLADGFESRKDLYNLYHILNHANLFGGSYIGQAKTMMSQLLQRA